MKKFLSLILFTAVSAAFLSAQETRWMSVGSLHNYYSSYGCEREEGRILQQQDGLRWPAIYKNQDMQAAKGLWIAATNYNDPVKGNFLHKVVHSGPRVSGVGEFFPVRFKLISKYEAPIVSVNGSPTALTTVDIDSVDPNLKYDRIIDNVVHTKIGLTMQRKIIGYSQQFHDNYIIYDYTFTNTGIIDDKGTTRPAATLTGVYFYYQYRYSVCADTRYVIGNATGWGINAVNDVRGDTSNPGPAKYFANNLDNNDIRASFTWHGKFPSFTQYDNIGGPIWTPYYDKTDTVGRLGAAQFVGVTTIYTQKTPTDTTNDKGQPSTTAYEESDGVYQRNNDHNNAVANTGEYGWITKGRVLPRHADKVTQTGDPSLGTSGGYSIANGYGPYTIAPGQSIRIVMAEAANGLSRDSAIAIGRRYKQGQITAAQKNDLVFTGKDSLFKTFRRALVNVASNYTIPQPPPPPATFSVNSGPGSIRLAWTPNSAGTPAVDGWEIWRAEGRYDSAYSKIVALPASATSYKDTLAKYDVAYYYYLTAIGKASDNNGGANTPSGALASSRYYTQTYDPAYRKLPAAGSLAEVKDKIVIVPNPYVINGTPGQLLYPGEPDKIVFKNVPGKCTIKIYSELGELIKIIPNTDEAGSVAYDMTTSSNQIIVSGVYIAVVETPKGERGIYKFVVIR